MATWLVTGGTGLIGSNVVRRLLEQGEQVRALVRAGSPTDELAALGAETVEGDVQSADDLLRAADGCELIVNSAALLGGASQDMAESRRTNADGSAHAYDAARTHGIRCVTLSSTPFLDQSVTLTEDATVAESWADDPYTQSKGAAYVEAKRRATEEGDDLVIVIPGGTYGPGVVLSRAMGASSYNRVLRGRAQRQAERLRHVPGAMGVRRGRGRRLHRRRPPGHRRAHLPGVRRRGRPQHGRVPQRRARGRRARTAASPRSASTPPTRPRSSATARPWSSWPPRRYPVPWFDNSATRAELGYAPRPLEVGLERTVAWLRANDQIS